MRHGDKMACEPDKRTTITVTHENWKTYCKLKGKHLLEMGKPEISFTEFANACIELSGITVPRLLELRREHFRAEIEKRK